MVALEQQIRHRDHLGPTFKGVAIHALPGLHERVFDLAREHFDPAQPVLELGAGSGALCLRMQEGGFDVIPVDLDGNDWRLDRPVIEADFNSIDWVERTFSGQRFHQVVAIEVIEHLENPSKFFREIAALLEDRGKLILSTPNVLSVPSITAAFKRGEFALFSADDCVSSGHISILPWWLLDHLASLAGLHMIASSGVCEIPMSKNKQRLVDIVRRFRARLLGLEKSRLIEGVNVILVFEKQPGFAQR